MEAAAHEKETETPKDQAPEDKIGSARSGSIKGYSVEWYDLRHTFLTRLGEVNTDPFTIQKIAGHASITMSQRYVHPTLERLEAAFARLETYNQARIAAKSNTEIVAVN